MIKITRIKWLLITLSLISLCVGSLAISNTLASNPFSTFEEKTSIKSSNPLETLPAVTNPAPSYDFSKAPPLNSFFEKYDQNSIHPEQLLPNGEDPPSDGNNPFINSNGYLNVQIDVSKVAYLPGESIEYSIQVTRGFTAMNNYPIRIVILNGDDFYRWYYDLGNSSIYDSFVGWTNDNGFYEGSFTPENEGSYTLLVMEPSENSYPLARRVVTVSELGIFWRIPFNGIKNTEMTSYALVTNISQFDPLPNATISLFFEGWSYSGENHTLTQIFSGITDQEGIILMQFVLPKVSNYYTTLILNATYNGASIQMKHYLWFSSYYSQHQPYSFITTTDKPIYQPGDNVKTRTIVFSENYWAVSKEPVVSSEVEVEFKNPDGFILYHKTLSTDEFGVLTWDFHFDSDVSVGIYYLTFRKGGAEETIHIEVDLYEKPDFRVNIDLESEYVPPGERIVGEIMAEYYFGKPVPGTVSVEIYYSGTIIDTLVGSLDDEGMFRFSWKIPKTAPTSDEPMEGLTLLVTVADPLDRQVETKAEVICTSDIYSYLWTNPYGYIYKGENITAHFSAYQYSPRLGDYWYSWGPVVNASVTITVFGTNAQEQTTKLFTLESRTSPYGDGTITFTIPEDYFNDYQLFLLELVVKTADGRKGVDQRTISLAAIHANITVTPSENISPGDEVQLSVNLTNIETGELADAIISLYIMDAEYDRMYYLSDYELKGTENFSIQLSSFAPEGKYYIRAFCTLYNYYDDSYLPTYYSGSQTFVVGSDYSLSLETDKDTYLAAEQLVITGQTNFISDSPIMIELTKRGIIQLITVNNSDGSFIITLDNLNPVAPQLTIFAYAVAPTGLVLEAFVRVEIIREINVAITTDKSTYEPGETVKIAISVTNEAGQPIDALGAFSLIDSSIYGVKADPLIEEPFFEEEQYWPQITLQTSWTAPMQYWWYWWLVEDSRYDTWGGNYPPETGYDVQMPSGSRSEFEGEIRDYLPESANWLPLLKIEAGQVEFSINLPDNIGEWTIRVFLTANEEGVVAKKTFKTFLPFFVDLKVPQNAVQDDVVIVRGIAYNYLSEESNVSLELTIDDLSILNNPHQIVSIPKDYLVEVRWTIYCRDFGSHNITLMASASIDTSHWYDGIRKPFVIQPNGVTLETIESGFLNNSLTIYYDLFEEHQYSAVDLILSPGMMDVAITSWERLVGYPYGCIEQTMSKILPDIMIYRYLEENGQLTDELALMLQDMLQTGLSRIASYQHDDGGWGWWSDDSSQSYMTAIVLYGLGLMQDFNLTLSEKSLTQGIDYLIEQQLPSGAFTTDSWRIDDLSFTAFVTRSLLVNSLTTDDQLLALNNAIDYFITTWQGQSDLRNPYAAALFIDATFDTAYENEPFITGLVDFILSESIIDQAGIYWESTTSNYWRALGGTVETTATAIIALSTVGHLEYFTTIRQGLSWLIDRQSYYGWGTTADTTAAIRAIVLFSEQHKEPIDCTIELTIGNWNTQFTFNENSTDFLPPEYLALEDYLLNGPNEITINQTGTGEIYYYFSAKQILRSDPHITIDEPVYASPGEEFSVEITLEPTSVIVYPVNILLENQEEGLVSIGESNYSIPVLTNPEVVQFSYQAPDDPGNYSVGGFRLMYTFADHSLEHFAPGIVVKTLTKVPLIVQAGLSPFSDQSIQPAINSVAKRTEREGIIRKENDLGLSISRAYSTTTGLTKGDTVEVSLTIDNQWETKEFIMIEDFIPAGFELDLSSLRDNNELTIISYTRSSQGITLFLSALPVGLSTISYRLIAIDIGSSIALPTKLSSMYDSWVVESEATIIGTLAVTIDPTTETVQTDFSNPVLQKKELSIDEGEEYHTISIKITAWDDTAIATVKILYRSDSSAWRMEEASPGQVLANGCQEFSAVLGEFIDEELFYMVIIEDQMGNIAQSSVESTIIPSIIIPFVMIILIVLIAVVIAISVSITTNVLKPKPVTKKILEENRLSAFKETEEDLQAYQKLEPPQNGDNN
ncbi:MAG: hypothetical protein GF308_12245 [Candidatus Heimdallarchaeota archaeon]|nr:hypothetical protein [Candidatus Heimdallarchaeota archaeon]